MINRGLQSISLVCAGADLHLLVNSNMLTQQGTKTIVKSIYLGVQL